MFGFFGIDDIARILALLICIVLHEFAHGYVALLNGDPTAKNEGRLTLNPLKHLDPAGFLMLLVLRFGYAKPVPVNYYNFKNRKIGMFTVAIAGVTVNLVLAFFATPIYLVMLNSSFFAWNYLGQFLFYFIYYLVFINIILFTFNLLPIYPLDGFRVVEAFTRYNNPYVRFMREYGNNILLGLILISVVRYFFEGFFGTFEFWEYLDVLSFVLDKVSNWIFTPFVMFWSLMI